MAHEFLLDEVSAPRPAAPAPGSYYVRFKDNIPLPYVDQVELHFAHIESTGWQTFAAQVPGATFHRAFPSLTLPQLVAFGRAPVPGDAPYGPKSLLQYHVMDVPAGPTEAQITDAFHAWPDVQSFEPVLRPSLPSGVFPVYPGNNGLYPKQQYLRRAPFGVNAEYAWLISGGTGYGQTLLELEHAWALNHVDLRTPSGDSRVERVYGQMTPGYQSHGTAVLGIICATDNDTHCIGIAPHTSRIWLLSLNGGGQYIHDVIVKALTDLAPNGDLALLPPGTVLLIEVEYQDAQGRRWPVEHLEIIRNAIYFASSWGVTVILAAGNGGPNGGLLLDNYVNPQGTYIYMPGTPGFVDTGALYVGAANCEFTQEQGARWHRHLNSNYGRRVSSFAQGSKVWTLASDGGDPDTGWTDGFDQTSAAAAIIAGAALCCQGMAQDSARHRALTPGELRSVFGTRDPSRDPNVRPNTRTEDPNAGIGVMPSLRFVGRNYLGTAARPEAPMNFNAIP